jgi:hypothetical protein
MGYLFRIIDVARSHEKIYVSCLLNAGFSNDEASSVFEQEGAMYV